MKPYYEANGVTLYHGDAREIIPTLPMVDAIITDPPYAETNLKWDKWVSNWPRLLLRTSRQLWAFGSFRLFWDHQADFLGWRLAQDVVWEKHNGSGMLTDRFRRVHEHAVHFYHGSWKTLYLDVPKVEPPVEARRGGSINARSSKPQHYAEISSEFSYDRDQPRLMRSVMPVRSCHGHAINETQKPEGIMAPLLHYSVPPGGVVLDPFAGSATTLLVARAQGKQAIGIEVRECQCEKAARRLEGVRSAESTAGDLDHEPELNFHG